jgi:HlyD family secretion protein
MKKIFMLLILIAAGSAALWWQKDSFLAGDKNQVNYRLSRVEERDIVKNVTAVGALSALVTVEVGCGVSGQIMGLLADYNSLVEAGQIIARIDPESFETLLRQSQAELSVSLAQLQTRKTQIQSHMANLQSAEAALEAIRASIKKAGIVLENTNRNLQRQKTLLDREMISKNEYEESEDAFEEASADLERLNAEGVKTESGVAAAKANLAVARSQVREYEANVELKVAALDKRKVDLENTVIRSPVDGVVIDRSVDKGQTVAASLSAPTLFTIAQDLRKMQVTTSVDEADIGQIKEGQSTWFTVDAYNDRKFLGKVTQIRKQGKTVQNVVTYQVIISADNSDLSLLPGMTADVAIELLKKEKVLAVPNSALRFTPTEMRSSGSVGLRAASSASGAGGNSGFGGGAGRPDPEVRIKQYTKKLKLTESQQDELRQIFAQISQKMRQSRESQGMNAGPGSRSSSTREQARKESQAAILRILDSEQKHIFNNMTASAQAQKGTLWKMNEEGRVEVIQVRLGVSDGSFTEVLGKGLQNGLQIVTGYQY